ncbi:Glycoprotein 3-alpha-L-fucosyltransferase A [Holothuria leucospilota]|uniref:Fucosyltransferase n=1 Tax=Holothuria leucospilota TaxID=206669 RepID=A0A9Q1C3I4_HOLLE|nr:Glycoprotein 3-alpha-L-fucosyltransferase A [Holothuria leucospilota]
MDILRTSVTFLAIATVIFILTTSYTIFNSQGDHVSCEKLLENSRELKEHLQTLQIDEEKLYDELSIVPGRKAELLRAIIASSLTGPRTAQNEMHQNDPENDSQDEADTEEQVSSEVEIKDTENKDISLVKEYQMCIFGMSPPSQKARTIGCKDPNVTVKLVYSDNVADIETSEVTFFTNTQQKYAWWHTVLTNREKHQRWALFSLLPPTTVSRETIIPKAFRSVTFHWTATYNYASDIPLPFGRYSPFSEAVSKPPLNITTKERLVGFVSSDCSVPKWPRDKFVSILKSYVDVEIFGCGNCEEECKEKLRGFKFILALEHTPCHGYITDVFWSALTFYHSVPIVWGAQPDDYKMVAPPDSYIDVREFKSIESLASRIKVLDKNPDEYRKFHEWRQHGQAELLMTSDNFENIPNDDQVCSVFTKYVDDYNEKSEFRDTNRDAWQGSCSIRFQDVIEGLPIPATIVGEDEREVEKEEEDEEEKE